jgi:hypothetical protein
MHLCAHELEQMLKDVRKSQMISWDADLVKSEIIWVIRLLMVSPQSRVVSKFSFASAAMNYSW